MTESSSWRSKATRTGALAARANSIAAMVSTPRLPFEPKPPADMVGDHPDLVVAELVAFCDQLHHMEDGLRRNMHGQMIAVEAGDGGMGLETAMRLAPVRKAPLISSGSIALRAALQSPRTVLGLVREGRRKGRGRSASRRCGRRRALRDVGRLFAAAIARKHDGASGLRAASRPITDGSSSLGDPMAAAACRAVVMIPRGDRGDRLADIAHNLVVAEQRNRRHDARQRRDGARSSEVICAWASGERTIRPSSCPSWRMSTVYLATPVTF